MFVADDATTTTAEMPPLLVLLSSSRGMIIRETRPLMGQQAITTAVAAADNTTLGYCRTSAPRGIWDCVVAVYHVVGATERIVPRDGGAIVAASQHLAVC
mmetsp:Transcript_12912/g.31470  ORF Transcript_12912/g.31470 Transcript_12912/m.31470 type:complete len:100 (+) Transcript_12912:1530-1829(+)